MSADSNAEPKSPEKLTPTDRLCPMLSIAVAIATPGTPFTATPCQGIRCALFIPMNDPSGNMVGGGCAITAIPQVLDGHAGNVGGMLKVLASRAKIGLAPGTLV